MSPSVGQVIQFLTDLYNKGLGYSALNTARSALSSVIEIEGKKVGEHPFVVRFLKGVFNLKPCIPKTNVSWDPQVVLDYLKTLSPVKTLDLKSLTIKCLSLLWLLTGQRGQSMQLIDVRNITINKNVLKIRFGDLLKTTRPGYQQRELTLKAYATDRRLCIVTVALEYLERRKVLCKEDVYQLFVSHQKPHDAVSKDTIARWVKETMRKAGLDISIFTPHSVRAASTSKAIRARVPITTILTTAGWSQENTFRKYYNKPIQQEGFAERILENHDK